VTDKTKYRQYEFTDAYAVRLGPWEYFSKVYRSPYRMFAEEKIRHLDIRV
jgi:hypothetical protein